jgi:Kef-type K+ transport system membrane component KefB
VALAFPLLAGLAYVRCVDTSALLGSAQNSTAFLLVFATAIAIASIPVISRIMLDLGIMETSFARIVIATAVIDDLVLYVILAVALTKKHGALQWDEAAILHLVFLMLVAGGCLLLAVNPMFGALAAGMVAGRAIRRQGVWMPKTFEWGSLKFFVPLYFALIGARLDLIHHFDTGYFVVFLTFACVVKAVSIYTGARAAGEPHSASLNLAAALNARGGPGIVLAAVSFDAGIINENFFAILVLTAVVTSMAAGSWLGRVVRSGAPLRDEACGLAPSSVARVQRASPTGH